MYGEKFYGCHSSHRLLLGRMGFYDSEEKSLFAFFFPENSFHSKLACPYSVTICIYNLCATVWTPRRNISSLIEWLT